MKFLESGSRPQPPTSRRRTDFRDKKSRDFSGEIVLERNCCPRTGFSGSNPWKILCHPVMSWYGSRAVGFRIGREITARTMFSSWKRFKRRNNPRFRCFFWEKRPWKRFSTNVVIRGKESTPQLIDGNKVVRAVMLLQKNLSRKISPEKSLDFWSQKSVLRPALCLDSARNDSESAREIARTCRN